MPKDGTTFGRVVYTLDEAILYNKKKWQRWI